MTFPQHRNKHLEEALLRPEDFLEYKRKSGRLRRGMRIPKRMILIYYESLLNYFKRNYEYEKLKIRNYQPIYVSGGVGVMRMEGIGSPHAVAYAEELIALGVDTFLNIGSSGGLQRPGVFLCDRAIRDEGTSHHYKAHGKYAYPHKDLTDSLGTSLVRLGIEFERGTTWTIDAPYRETKAEVARYRKEGVSTVDMEASALFTLAEVKGVKIASAFVVSDILAETWELQLYKKNMRRELNRVFDAAYACLRRR